jgi:hypothetical protein
VARKTAPQQQVRVNRAQLKALAARQAMTAAPAPTTSETAAPTAPAGLESIDFSQLAPRAARRTVLTREQEYAYIRADLIRLIAIFAVLLVVLIVAYIFLRGSF